MYQNENMRKELKKQYNNIEEYLGSLEMNLKIFKNEEYLISRVTQLCQRTNQFNLTTKRYTEEDISSFVKSKDSDVVALSLQDKFGDMGIIGTAIIKYLDNQAIIDTFLLSCRSLGRGVENVFLNTCLKLIEDRGLKLINSYYYKTKKNHQVEDFLNTNGFKLQEIKNETEKIFVFDFSKNLINKNPKYFNILNQ